MTVMTTLNTSHVRLASHDVPAAGVARLRRNRRWPAGRSLLAGPANVIMELARPGVGYGVLESRVEGGRVDRHPIKRARTTFTYVAVALRGSDAQKAAIRGR